MYPVHGELFTHHMSLATWSEQDGWTRPVLGPRRDLVTDPGLIGLHYGQVIFEGLKAHRQADGSIAIFRPLEHGRRFQRSARRLAMPELPEELFIAAAEQVVAADDRELSDDPDLSLYLRPLMFASDASLALRTSHTYTFLMMAFVTGAFFGDGVDAVRVWVNRDYPRAMPGGTGDVKCAANYGPAFQAQVRAEQEDCQQVVWLDAVERRWVEELGGMNLFFVRGEDELVTSPLTGTLLPGVTRDSLMTLARERGLRVTEERVSIDQWRRESESGVLTEAFSCGTAAVVTAVGEVKDGDQVWRVGDGTPGKLTTELRTALVDLHHGLTPGHPWLHPVR
ncbi:branched-chain amino acid aminotransferase [[Actinomadura] parvosata]|uniref:branched-chain amino acid aminotransferase n=1 Tax=[Actinomadura] parvosata TaxID=1955412 RepID=UPI00406CD2DD